MLRRIADRVGLARAASGAAEGRLARRALGWATSRRERVRGHNPWELSLRLLQECHADRISGLAAEMAFFALLSFVPTLVATGAALGYVEKVVGAQEVDRSVTLIVTAMRLVFNQEFTEAVLAPLVEGLLFPREGRGGLALGGLLVAFLLSSRVFTATMRALDLAYDVEERRRLVYQRLVALGLALASILAVAITLTVMVVGPLLGGGQELARRFGAGRLFELLWQVFRVPVLLLLVVAFLVVVYRFGPNVRHTWRQCLPGALLGVGLWVLVSLGLRVYLAAGGGQAAPATPEDEVLAALTRAVGAIVAAVLWIYLSGLAILVGGEFNAELARRRPGGGVVPGEGTGPRWTPRRGV